MVFPGLFWSFWSFRGYFGYFRCPEYILGIILAIFEFISVILEYWCYFGHFRIIWVALMIPWVFFFIILLVLWVFWSFWRFFFGHLVFLGHFGHFRAFRCILEGLMIFQSFWVLASNERICEIPILRSHLKSIDLGL